MNLELILLDLDETLLSTQALHDARHSRTPLELRKLGSFDAIRLHDGIAESLGALASLTRVGLVTSSLRWYADQILSALLPDQDFAVQVTYEDVENIKPHPDPLLRALTVTGVNPQHALYVGDADLDFGACVAAGVEFVGAGWVDNPTFPPSAPRVRTPQDLVKLVECRA